MSPRFLFAGLAVAGLAACAPTAPPRALAGLWSVGEAACAQGRGLTFDAEQVTARIGPEAEPLLQRVRYTLSRDRDGLTVNIRHALGPVGEGVLVMRQGQDGWLRPVARRVENVITGGARAPLRGVGYADALTVRPCALPTRPRAIEADAQSLRGRGV